MEEGETEAIPTRKELRKQKLMEYLTTKGKLKQPSLRSNLRNDCNVKKSVASTLKVVAGKENKTPAVRCSYESKKAPTLAAGLLIPPGRKVFEVNKKVGVKDNILNKQKNTHSLSATNGTAQPRPNPLLTRVHTIKSSKDNQNTASHVKKLANTGIQSSGKTSSNTAHAAVTNSDSRFRSSSNPSWSCPMKTASVRMSLGPLVKTKTGLIPAVTQPRSSQNLTQTSATTGGTSTARSFAGQSSMSSFAQRKTTHAASRNNSVIKRTTASLTTRATIEVQDPNKNKSKILLGKHFQPPCKSQLSSRLKSNSSKCITEPIKSEERVGMSKPTKSYGQSTHRSTKPRSEGERQKNATLQISSGPVNRCTSRVVSKIGQGVVAEQVGKTKTCKETNSKRGHSSANATQPQTGVRRPGAPVMSQTVPLPTRTISHTGQATNFKMTKAPVRVIPQTEGKKMTAAQEERMRKLQEWREAKGISYKRPPMPVKPQARRTVALPGPFWATMKDEDEAHSLICAVDRSLADCLKLLGEGCPPDQVKEVLSRLPTVSHKFAKYWICQARLMEQEGNLDVLPMFEEAVRVVLEPVDELRTVVFEILKKKDETQASDENGKEGDQVPAGENTPEGINNPVMTPKPVRALIWGEKGDSSVVKYKITATPGGPSSQQKEPTRVNGQEVRFFTPVRRSVRIKRASLHYPASLQDHDLCVASYNDLISEEDKERSEKQEDSETNPSADETILYIYRENEALKDKVCVQLVCDDEGI